MNAVLVSFFLTISLWAISWLYFRAYLKRRTSVERVFAEMRDEVDKLIAEIDSTTDRDVLLVEDRVKAFRLVIEEADKRITLYQDELSKRSQERAYADLGRRAGRTAERLDDRPLEAPLRLGPEIETGSRAETAASRTTAADHPPSSSAVSVADTPRFTIAAVPIEPKAPSFAERATEMYHAGFSPDLIAKRLGAALGEVELAIALCSPRTDADGDDTGN